MRSNKRSKFERCFVQLNNVMHYDNGITIFEKESELLKDGFRFEFSIKPTPLSRMYRILIVYIAGYQPYVYVIHPNIVQITGANNIPHLYSQEKQRLCLTYPYFDEWKSDESIADIYIPWIAMWLYYFEEWLFSGKWKGGGLHPGEEPEEYKSLKPRKKTKKSPLNRVNNLYDRRKKKFLSELDNEAA